MTRVLLLMAVVLGSAGCGTLEVSMPGAVGTGILEPPASSPRAKVVLAFDRLGNLTVNGQPLDLPHAREDRRFAVAAVDAGSLPPVWRPAHARDGGVLVSWLLRASPLAIAGLRPFDRVRAVNGAAVRGPAQLVDALERARGTVRLAVTKPDGRRTVIVAHASGPVGDAEALRLPLVFERRSSTIGQATGVGPFDLLGYERSRLMPRVVKDPACGHLEYRRRFEWGILGNLVLYESERDPRTGRTRSRLRLLWLFHFGDDLDRGSS